MALNYRISNHAEASILERGIPIAVVRRTVEQPQQVVPAGEGVSVYQSVFLVDGIQFLIRVPVRHNLEPALVLTAYRTRKIEKYWDSSGLYDREQSDEG